MKQLPTLGVLWLTLVGFWAKGQIPESTLQTATFGAGCYWCTEAVFERVDGVESVVSGYCGGTIRNPTYKEVNTGLTGHVEVVKLWFDPAKISYEELLEIFWATHDPTTPNQQGIDIGPQYQSVIFFHTKEQYQLARAYKRKLNISGVFEKPIVTEIRKARDFYRADDFLQDYYDRNPQAPYCTTVIDPKLDKLREVFGSKLKTD